jgi:PqqD family protein of HPr-rel-A system
MTLKLRGRVSAADTEYGTVLLDEASGDYWNLNPTGALVVRTLLDGGDATDAAQRLMAEYAVDAGTARTDVGELLDRLRSAGLIEEEST